ncbi:protein disulfide-isomerase A4 isoform 3-T3 [Hipposideros larvatus]
MRPRKACLLVLLLALAQLLAVASAEGPDEDPSKEDAIEDEDEEDEGEEEEDDLEVKEENGVLVLNDANFDNFVADKDTVLLEFYAPWCGHCKQFAPEYEKIASTLKEHDPPIAVAKIDATSESALASRFGVSGYPTIKILKKGQAVDYEGSRTQEEIIAKVKEISQPNWTPPPEVTLVLTKENFDEVVNDADIILVEFYAPWCGHCKKLAPEYEKAAKELSKRSPPIPLAKVDATAETDLAKRFDVTGYPTLKIFRKGKAFDYNGPREKYGIVDYMIEQSGPPSKEILALKQVQEFLKDGDDVVVIGVFKAESDPAYQLYQDAANNLREDYKFHHTFSTEIAKFLKASPGKLVIMQPEKFQSKYEPRINVMDIQGSTEGSAIKDFVLKHTLPLVGHRKPSNDGKRYTRRPLVVVYYSVDFSFDYRAATQFWRSKVLEVAKDFPEYTFAVADEDDFATEVKDLGLSESGEDVNAAILDESGRKFAMEPDEFDSDTLREFVTAFKKGGLSVAGPPLAPPPASSARWGLHHSHPSPACFPHRKTEASHQIPAGAQEQQGASQGRGGEDLRCHRDGPQEGCPHRVLRALVRALQAAGARVHRPGQEVQGPQGPGHCQDGRHRQRRHQRPLQSRGVPHHLLRPPWGQKEPS